MHTREQRENMAIPERQVENALGVNPRYPEHATLRMTIDVRRYYVTMRIRTDTGYCESARALIRGDDRRSVGAYALRCKGRDAIFWPSNAMQHEAGMFTM
jgi:hypothetical protein